MSDPFIGFGYDTLEPLPTVAKGQLIQCPTCHEQHELYCGKNSATGEESTLLLFYRCTGQTYLAAVQGKLVTGVEADVKGEV